MSFAHAALQFISRLWNWLAHLRPGWRWSFKIGLFLMVFGFALFPNPVLFVKQLNHLRHVEALIQPDLPEMVKINEDIDANWRKGLTRQDEFRAVEKYVYATIPYEYDWYNWGNVDYWPSAKEVLERKREDCDGRAILAVSILRSRGFKSAMVVGNMQHVWVTVDKGELMGPQKDANVRRVNGKMVVTMPSLRTVLSGTSMISKFPAARILMILAAAMVLAYHPCRNMTGAIGVGAVTLLGYVLFLDWANRFPDIKDTLLIQPLVVALLLVAAAWVGALLAGRIAVRKFVVKPKAEPQILVGAVVE